MRILRPVTPGERLRAWRKAQQVSQGKLAEMLGVDQSTVSLIEARGQEPKASVAEKIREITAGQVTWASSENGERDAVRTPSPDETGPRPAVEIDEAPELAVEPTGNEPPPPPEVRAPLPGVETLLNAAAEHHANMNRK